MSRQLPFVFADSPKGSEDAPKVSALTGRAFMLHTAKSRKTSEISTPQAAEVRPMTAVAALSNLAEALRRVARNKGAHGVDGRSVVEVVGESHRLLPRLRHALLTGQYRPGDIRRVWIPKPGGGQRGLGIPNVVDRLVQQAVHQVLEPVFEAGFHDSSHGFRRHRGAKTAIAEAVTYVDEGRGWVVAIDLSKFFDRVNHQRLLARMSQKVQDQQLLKLVRLMLKAAVVMPDGTKVQSTEGTPQGGPLSPLLSNIVLDELDWEMARRGLCFVRYADDFNVFVRSERAAHRVMAALTRFIEGRLRLKVNVKKSEVARPDQVHFLGFSLCKQPGGEGVEVLLSERTVQRMTAKIRALTPRSLGGSLEVCMERVSRYVTGWAGYFQLCTHEHARYFFGRFDAHIRRRLRAIIITQRKRPRFLFRLLVKRGIRPVTAQKSAYIGGVWKRSHTYGLDHAFPNKWFHQRMASLWKTWLKFNPPATVMEVSTGQLRLPGLEIDG
jgi:group II intron reverse transcriptase/maturase